MVILQDVAGVITDSQLLNILFEIDPFEFEQFIGDLLKRMGYNVEVTKPTGDGGIDIEAEFATPLGGVVKYVIQVKRHRNQISPKDLQALAGAIAIARDSA